jgi:hypothetical protein
VALALSLALDKLEEIGLCHGIGHLHRRVLEAVGRDAVKRAGYPPVIDPTVNPDASVLSLIATIWW